MERCSAAVCENDDLNLRLGLPGRDESKRNKRSSSEMQSSNQVQESAAPAPKAQVVGWPPVRSYRKNAMRQSESGMFVKVSMDGAPYLRKIDVNSYNNYLDLLKALETMFKCTIGVYSEREGYSGSEFVPTYEDKDGDWMLVGDVPWEMFITCCNCKRLRIMKASEAKGKLPGFAFSFAVDTSIPQYGTLGLPCTNDTK